jgi:hypothetical protein
MSDESKADMAIVTGVEVDDGFGGCEYVEAVPLGIFAAIESGNECYRTC